ncbi:serine-rich adhesin for platelets-like [Watersipora subatra]|uniref:serine-rich adhesin for platelets-like n=1 Tax=Watersipora subatra TaxID=2589382 RepID=UPI00355AD1CF
MSGATVADLSITPKEDDSSSQVSDTEKWHSTAYLKYGSSGNTYTDQFSSIHSSNVAFSTPHSTSASKQGNHTNQQLSSAVTNQDIDQKTSQTSDSIITSSHANDEATLTNIDKFWKSSAYSSTKDTDPITFATEVLETETSNSKDDFSLMITKFKTSEGSFSSKVPSEVTSSEQSTTRSSKSHVVISTESSMKNTDKPFTQSESTIQNSPKYSTESFRKLGTASKSIRSTKLEDFSTSTLTLENGSIVSSTGKASQKLNTVSKDPDVYTLHASKDLNTEQQTKSSVMKSTQSRKFHFSFGQTGKTSPIINTESTMAKESNNIFKETSSYSEHATDTTIGHDVHSSYAANDFSTKQQTEPLTTLPTESGKLDFSFGQTGKISPVINTERTTTKESNDVFKETSSYSDHATDTTKGHKVHSSYTANDFSTKQQTELLTTSSTESGKLDFSFGQTGKTSPIIHTERTTAKESTDVFKKTSSYSEHATDTTKGHDVHSSYAASDFSTKQQTKPLTTSSTESGKLDFSFELTGKTSPVINTERTTAKESTDVFKKTSSYSEHVTDTTKGHDEHSSYAANDFSTMQQTEPLTTSPTESGKFDFSFGQTGKTSPIIHTERTTAKESNDVFKETNSYSEHATDTTKGHDVHSSYAASDFSTKQQTEPLTTSSTESGKLDFSFEQTGKTSPTIHTERTTAKESNDVFKETSSYSEHATDTTKSHDVHSSYAASDFSTKQQTEPLTTSSAESGKLDFSFGQTGKTGLTIHTERTTAKESNDVFKETSSYSEHATDTTKSHDVHSSYAASDFSTKQQTKPLTTSSTESGKLDFSFEQTGKTSPTIHTERTTAKESNDVFKETSPYSEHATDTTKGHYVHSSYAASDFSTKQQTKPLTTSSTESGKLDFSFEQTGKTSPTIHTERTTAKESNDVFKETSSYSEHATDTTKGHDVHSSYAASDFSTKQQTKPLTTSSTESGKLDFSFEQTGKTSPTIHTERTTAKESTDVFKETSPYSEHATDTTKGHDVHSSYAASDFSTKQQTKPLTTSPTESGKFDFSFGQTGKTSPIIHTERTTAKESTDVFKETSPYSEHATDTTKGHKVHSSYTANDFSTKQQTELLMTSSTESGKLDFSFGQTGKTSPVTNTERTTAKESTDVFKKTSSYSEHVTDTTKGHDVHSSYTASDFSTKQQTKPLTTSSTESGKLDFSFEQTGKTSPTIHTKRTTTKGSTDVFKKTSSYSEYATDTTKGHDVHSSYAASDFSTKQQTEPLTTPPTESGKLDFSFEQTGKTSPTIHTERTTAKESNDVFKETSSYSEHATDTTKGHDVHSSYAASDFSTKQQTKPLTTSSTESGKLDFSFEQTGKTSPTIHTERTTAKESNDVFKETSSYSEHATDTTKGHKVHSSYTANDFSTKQQTELLTTSSTESGKLDFSFGQTGKTSPVTNTERTTAKESTDVFKKTSLYSEHVTDTTKGHDVHSSYAASDFSTKQQTKPLTTSSTESGKLDFSFEQTGKTSPTIHTERTTAKESNDVFKETSSYSEHATDTTKGHDVHSSYAASDFSTKQQTEPLTTPPTESGKLDFSFEQTGKTSPTIHTERTTAKESNDVFKETSSYSEHATDTTKGHDVRSSYAASDFSTKQQTKPLTTSSTESSKFDFSLGQTAVKSSVLNTEKTMTEELPHLSEKTKSYSYQESSSSKMTATETTVSDLSSQETESSNSDHKTPFTEEPASPTVMFSTQIKHTASSSKNHGFGHSSTSVQPESHTFDQTTPVEEYAHVTQMTSTSLKYKTDFSTSQPVSSPQLKSEVFTSSDSLMPGRQSSWVNTDSKSTEQAYSDFSTNNKHDYSTHPVEIRTSSKSTGAMGASTKSGRFYSSPVMFTSKGYISNIISQSTENLFFSTEASSSVKTPTESDGTTNIPWSTKFYITAVTKELGYSTGTTNFKNQFHTENQQSSYSDVGSTESVIPEVSTKMETSGSFWTKVEVSSPNSYYSTKVSTVDSVIGSDKTERSQSSPLITKPNKPTITSFNEITEQSNFVTNMHSESSLAETRTEPSVAVSSFLTTDGTSSAHGLTSKDSASNHKFSSPHMKSTETTFSGNSASVTFRHSTGKVITSAQQPSSVTAEVHSVSTATDVNDNLQSTSPVVVTLGTTSLDVDDSSLTTVSESFMSNTAKVSVAISEHPAEVTSFSTDANGNSNSGPSFTTYSKTVVSESPSSEAASRDFKTNTERTSTEFFSQSSKASTDSSRHEVDASTNQQLPSVMVSDSPFSTTESANGFAVSNKVTLETSEHSTGATSVQTKTGYSTSSSSELDAHLSTMQSSDSFVSSSLVWSTASQSSVANTERASTDEALSSMGVTSKHPAYTSDISRRQSSLSSVMIPTTHPDFSTQHPLSGSLATNTDRVLSSVTDYSAATTATKTQKEHTTDRSSEKEFTSSMVKSTEVFATKPSTWVSASQGSKVTAKESTTAESKTGRDWVSEQSTYARKTSTDLGSLSSIMVSTSAPQFSDQTTASQPPLLNTTEKVSTSVSKYPSDISSSSSRETKAGNGISNSGPETTSVAPTVLTASTSILATKFDSKASTLNTDKAHVQDLTSTETSTTESTVLPDISTHQDSSRIVTETTKTANPHFSQTGDHSKVTATLATENSLNNSTDKTTSSTTLSPAISRSTNAAPADTIQTTHGNKATILFDDTTVESEQEVTMADEASTNSQGETSTKPLENYSWTTPKAWNSARLYPWGSEQGDVDILDAAEHWTKYSKCHSVSLNGKAGSVFFTKRHYAINICNNGLMSFDLDWMQYYPWSFGLNYWYEQQSFFSPLWSIADEVTMSLLSDDWPQARTQIYYQVYERAVGMSDQTAAILSRAEQDVLDSSYTVSSFQPSWVLVVTWLNIAGDVGCRWPIMYKRLYGFSWGDSSLEYCRLQAQQFPLNHFQAVYITDGVYSFIKYNYPEEGINWVYPGVAADISTAVSSSTQYLYGVAAGGYQAPSSGSVNYTNLQSSGTLDYIAIDSVSGNLIDGRVGEWLFRVEDSDGVEEASVQCRKWVATQNRILYAFYNRIAHCPQNLWQAWWDPAFRTHSYQFNDRFNSWCVQSVFPDRLFGLKQRCCYDLNWDSRSFTTLITEFPYHGHVVNPFNPADEEEGYEKCCVHSTDTCKEFYLVRPVNDGRRYIPPALSKYWPWFGDPHIITSDGLSYTFNGLGEYLFTKIGENDTVIQARTERVVLENGTLGQATYFSAICVATFGLPSVQVQINKSPPGPGLVNNTQLIVNGSLVDVSVIEEDANSTQSIEGVSSEIQFERSNVTLTVLFSSGVSLAITPNNGMLTITLGLPSSVKRTTVGLTGTFDDDQENDLTYLNGTGHIPVNSSESDIFEWGSTFAVSEEDSIMYYTDNTDWYTFNNNSFVPVFIDDIDNWVWSTEEFRAAAYDLCETDTSCLYDVYITGDLSVGESSKQTAVDSESTSAKLNNFAPTIDGANSVLVIGGYFEYSMTVNDSNGDDITVTTNIQTTITMVGDNVTISGQITNSTSFVFTITARDAAGAANSKTLLTMFCKCVNNGTCLELTEEEQEAIETNSVTLACVCPTGYTGDLCDTDLNACELVASPCYPSVLCVDLPAPADHEGYTCGDCPAGYTGDGKTCNDIDECTGDVCGHICINSPGSFVCACRTGYTLNIDGSTCDDIDECLTDPCHQACNNTDGSYICSCHSGFVLTSDNINCEPSNPCEESNSCDQVNGLCNIEDGQDVCYCTKGYALSNDGVTCEDINECLLDTDACVQNCTNTAGGYICSCGAGYSLAADGTSCDDINECSSGQYDCLATQICNNKVGGYSCDCPGSSVLVDGQCTVISQTSPVTEITSSPPVEAEANSVSFSLQGMTKGEFSELHKTSFSQYEV